MTVFGGKEGHGLWAALSVRLPCLLPQNHTGASAGALQSHTGWLLTRRRGLHTGASSAWGRGLPPLP